MRETLGGGRSAWTLWECWFPKIIILFPNYCFQDLQLTFSCILAASWTHPRHTRYCWGSWQDMCRCKCKYRQVQYTGKTSVVSTCYVRVLGEDKIRIIVSTGLEYILERLLSLEYTHLNIVTSHEVVQQLDRQVDSQRAQSQLDSH